MKKTFSPPQVAKYFGTSPESVIEFIKSGELTAFNVGRGKVKPRYRISQQAIDDFEADRSAAVQKKSPRRRRRYQPAASDYFQ